MAVTLPLPPSAPGPPAPPAAEIIDRRLTVADIGDHVTAIVLTQPWRLGWLAGFGLSLLLLGVFAVSTVYLIAVGVGIWGVNVPVAWGFAIANFVWWIGIGHAGTLLSAILLLVHQPWRESINRLAEAMTIFAVVCAGLFPILHLGRPWFFYWLVPYPTDMGVWPQFRSPLIWDFFAVLSYFTVSLVFWYLGMIPDLATLRDRARSRVAQVVYGALAMGWRGSVRHWGRYEKAYLLLAGLATPLVVSVHSIVALDFAYTIVPGWHTTIFPPYFVAGAIYSGIAMVLTLAVPLRAIYRLQRLITVRHLENCAKLLLAAGLIVAYAYVMEHFFAWYSADEFERSVHLDRAVGIYAPAFWTYIVLNVVVVQAVWFRRVRRSPALLFTVGVLVNIGMWLERVVIVVQSLHRDYLVSAWGFYWPTVWDWLTLAGSLGLFLSLYFLFVRFLPILSIAETRKLLVEVRSGEREP